MAPASKGFASPIFTMAGGYNMGWLDGAVWLSLLATEAMEIDTNKYRNLVNSKHAMSNVNLYFLHVHFHTAVFSHPI